MCLGSTWCGTGPQGDMRTDLEQCDPEDCASVMEFAGKWGLESYTSVIDPSKIGPKKEGALFYHLWIFVADS